MTQETEIPEDVLSLYASLDGAGNPPQRFIDFAHRLVEDVAISGGDLEPVVAESRDLALAIARAILAERERCAKVVESYDEFEIAIDIRSRS